MKKKLFTKYTWRFAFIILLIATSAHAENNQQKQNQLEKKISSASTNLKKSRTTSKELRKKVLVAEDKLNSISRKLHSTELDINRLTTKLNKSNTKKTKLLKQTDEQKGALAQQMQALYTSGKQSHLRLLLKQDDPSDISRTIKYFEYMNKHRLKRIRSINKRLDKVKLVQTQITKDTKSLKTLQKQQGDRKITLKKAVSTKEKSLKAQRKIVVSNQQKLTKLRKEESRLAGVIKRLAAKQKKERIEREKQEEREKLAKIKAKKLKNEKKLSSITTKKKPKIKRHYVPNKPFSSLRGKLAWPVRGSMKHRYGSKRNSKQKWKAVVISAPGGTKVHAVARGKVEYSGRLNGYGYVIIIRHDKNYRSIYGYNRSVYKKEGQIVKAGEIIAAVGNSGGLNSSGLYFEIRKSTTHQNPAKWCR